MGFTPSSKIKNLGEAYSTYFLILIQNNIVIVKKKIIQNNVISNKLFLKNTLNKLGSINRLTGSPAQFII